MLGSWTIVENIPACNLPQKVASGFTETTKDLLGANYKPLVYCATQVVNGTNHMIICEQTLLTNPPKKAIIAMKLHQSLPADGEKFSILSIENIV